MTSQSFCVIQQQFMIYMILCHRNVLVPGTTLSGKKQDNENGVKYNLSLL
jgi:hypothetical protein